MGIPRYTYVDNADGSTCAQVRLPDGTSFSGENSATKELVSVYIYITDILSTFIT